jgi:hypothetical protein
MPSGVKIRSFMNVSQLVPETFPTISPAAINKMF